MLSKQWMNDMFKQGKTYKEYVNTLWEEYSKLVECIEQGHDYAEAKGGEPDCQRCGHYGPGDALHMEEIELAQVRKELETTRRERDENAKQLQAIKDGFSGISELAAKLGTMATFLGIDVGGVK